MNVVGVVVFVCNTVFDIKMAETIDPFNKSAARCFSKNLQVYFPLALFDCCSIFGICRAQHILIQKKQMHNSEGIFSKLQDLGQQISCMDF